MNRKLKDPAVLRGRWVRRGLVMLQSGRTFRVAMRTRLCKCSTEQLRFATHREALGAEILDDCELGPLFRTIAQGGCNAGVDQAREGAPPAHVLGEAVQRDESGASWAQPGLD